MFLWNLLFFLNFVSFFYTSICCHYRNCVSMNFRIPKIILRLVKLVVDSDHVALMALSLSDVYPPSSGRLLLRCRCKDGCTSRGVKDLCCGESGGLCCPNIASIIIKVSGVRVFGEPFWFVGIKTNLKIEGIYLEIFECLWQHRMSEYGTTAC